MSPARISARLAGAIAALDEIAGWFEQDELSSTDIRSVASDLTELKLEIEREEIRTLRMVPA